MLARQNSWQINLFSEVGNMGRSRTRTHVRIINLDLPLACPCGEHGGILYLSRLDNNHALVPVSPFVAVTVSH